jgi:LysM repeat protein
VTDRWRAAILGMAIFVVTLAAASALMAPSPNKPTQSDARFTFSPPRTASAPSTTPRPPVQTPQMTTASASASASTSASASASPKTSVLAATATPEPTPRTATIVHVVKPGESFTSIARSYGLKREYLLVANPLIPDPDRLMPGDKVVVPPTGWTPESSLPPPPAS